MAAGNPLILKVFLEQQEQVAFAAAADPGDDFDEVGVQI